MIDPVAKGAYDARLRGGLDSASACGEMQVRFLNHAFAAWREDSEASHAPPAFFAVKKRGVSPRRSQHSS